MPPVSLTLLPLGGLCNRMNAVASLLQLQASLPLRVRVVWDINAHCHAAFTDLFQPLTAPDFSLESHRFVSPLWQHDMPRNLRSASRLRRLFGLRSIDYYRPAVDGDLRALLGDGSRRVFLSTCHAVVPVDAALRRFVPTPVLQAKIDAVTADFGTATYGLHIRRGDHALCIDRSPLALFEAKMQELVAADPATRFYLATDDAAVKERLRAAFPERVRTYESATLRRDTKEGMQDAVVDLYALSRTQRIFGSFSSSYSEVAARLGDIPLDILERA